MPNLDWSQCPAVESVPGRVSGAWTFRNPRTPVSALFENLLGGASTGQVADWADVSREEVDAVLAFVARNLEKEPFHKETTK